MQDVHANGSHGLLLCGFWFVDCSSRTGSSAPTEGSSTTRQRQDNESVDVIIIIVSVIDSFLIVLVILIDLFAKISSCCSSFSNVFVWET